MINPQGPNEVAIISDRGLEYGQLRGNTIENVRPAEDNMIRLDYETRASTDHQLIVRPGDIVALLLPYSEVCMHMGVAGRTMLALVQERSVQLLEKNDKHELRLFSAPITHGEAGIYTEANFLYTYRPRGEIHGI